MLKKSEEADAEAAFGNAVGKLVQHGGLLATRVTEAYHGAQELPEEVRDQHGLAAARRYMREHLDELIAELFAVGNAAQTLGGGGELALGVTQEMVVEVVGHQVEIVGPAGALPVKEGQGDGQG